VNSSDFSGSSSLADLAALGRPRLLAMVRRRLDPALARRIDTEEVLRRAAFRFPG
jgi:hypothetical protein